MGFPFLQYFYVADSSPSLFWLKADKTPCEWQLSVALLQSTSACQTDSLLLDSHAIFRSLLPQEFFHWFQFADQLFLAFDLALNLHVFLSSHLRPNAYTQCAVALGRKYLSGDSLAIFHFPTKCKMQQMSLKTWHKNIFYAYSTSRMHFSSSFYSILCCRGNFPHSFPFPSPLRSFYAASHRGYKIKTFWIWEV